MAEVNVPYLRDNHVIDRTTVRRDIWLLLQAFMASRSISQMWAHEWFDGHSPIFSLDSEFQETEITKSLISCCINIRILDDAGDIAPNQFVCGNLWKDHDNDPENTHSLSFREACNKVIHAKKVRWDVERLDGEELCKNDHEPKFITPCLYLYGDLHGRNWRAELSILKFIEAAATLVP